VERVRTGEKEMTEEEIQNKIPTKQITVCANCEHAIDEHYVSSYFSTDSMVVMRCNICEEEVGTTCKVEIKK
jgi:hypothetical protein